MAYIISVVCFCVALHGFAEGAQRIGLTLHEGWDEAIRSRPAIKTAIADVQDHHEHPAGLGNDIDDYIADITRRQRQRQLHQGLGGSYETEWQLAEGHNTFERSSLVELNSSVIGASHCPSPERAFPDVFHSSSLLGRGGFGSAYRVTPKLCPERALVLKTTANTRGAWMETLLGEKIKSGAFGLVVTFGHALQETSPVRNHDGNTVHQKCLFMLMEYADSGNLASKLKAGLLSVKEKALIFYQILRGLQSFHRRGIVHRDIKLENIFLAKDQVATKKRYRPLIGDFGLACCDDNSGKGCRLSEGAWLDPCDTKVTGTLGYMSPRVAKRLPAAPEDDLWSMGKLLLEMIHNSNGKQLDVMKLTEEESKFPLHGNPKTYLQELGKFVSREMRGIIREHDSNPLRDLLKYLLCNGCEGRVGARKTDNAVELTQKWLKYLKVEVDEIQLNRVDQKDALHCTGKVFHRHLLVNISRRMML